jgi:hypothetical protein
MNNRQSGTEEMWRCRQCGKWSHAKRRPLRHKRHVDEYVDDERLVAEVAWSQEHDTGAWVDSVWIWCGPFDRYEARHSDHYSPPALDLDKLPAPKDSRPTWDEPINDDEAVPF